MTIGPGFLAGASMILDSPEFFKIRPTFTWKADVHATFPITPVVNAGLGIGYESHGTNIHVFNNKEQDDDIKVTYLSFNPHFVFSGFSLGMIFGVPVNESEAEFFPGTDSEDPPVMLMPHIGGIISLADMEDGWLSLVIEGGYSLSELYEQPDSDFVGNWNHVSLMMGLRYEFAIPGTEQEDQPIVE